MRMEEDRRSKEYTSGLHQEIEVEEGQGNSEQKLCLVEDWNQGCPSDARGPSADHFLLCAP
jgi:hypothetical protein